MSDPKPEKRCAIIGTAPSYRLTPWDDPTLEIWTLNDEWIINLPRSSRHFDLHPFELFYFRDPKKKLQAVDIPAGVFVPRSVRLLATDPLLDDDFRQRWFGWGDPARVLVEYAQLRAQWGWKLVAAATTAGVNVLRDAGVEHSPSCSGDTNPLLQHGVEVPAPVLDDMHVHRLAVLWPEVYSRLLRIMDADPIFQDRIVSAVTAAMINAATTQAQVIDGGIDEALRLVWMIRGSDREPSLQQWADYDKAAKALNVMTAMRRPAFATNTGAVADPSDTTEALADYRAHWMVARTAEHIGGWSRRPLPLPDMCYAAAATGDPDLRDMIVKALISVEEDLQYEAPR